MKFIENLYMGRCFLVSRFLSVELQVKPTRDTLVNEWALGAVRIAGGEAISTSKLKTYNFHLTT